jgi:hypothetical protein
MNAKTIVIFSILGFLILSLVLLISLPHIGGTPVDDEKPEAREGGEADEEVSADPLPANLRDLNVSAGQRIESPVTLSGEARLWYFEASFPISITDREGNILAQSPAQAQGEWMTEEFVPFEATLEFDISEETRGFIVYEKDNPSGLPEHAEVYRLPVILTPSEEQTMTVMYYLSPEGDQGPSNYDCSEVKPLSKIIPETGAPARAALEVLIEASGNVPDGYATNIPRDVEINTLTVENGTAYVDFSRELNQVAGSCAVEAARAQIESTLKQFPTVSRVEISVEGNIDEALQP